MNLSPRNIVRDCNSLAFSPKKKGSWTSLGFTTHTLKSAPPTPSAVYVTHLSLWELNSKAHNNQTPPSQLKELDKCVARSLQRDHRISPALSFRLIPTEPQNSPDMIILKDCTVIPLSCTVGKQWLAKVMQTAMVTGVTVLLCLV